MTEEAKKARQEYRREWQRKNKDRVKAYNERYWERKAAAMKAAKSQLPPEPDAAETEENKQAKEAV